MKLYHYTSLLHIKPIALHGSLWKGDIPLTNDVSKYGKEGHAVWFTTCDYAKENEHGLENPICDKSEIRFTADIDPDDPRLFKWSEYARLNKVNKKWYDAVNDVGGGLADTWWLFISPISLKELTVARKKGDKYIDVNINDIKRLPDEQNIRIGDIGMLF